MLDAIQKMRLERKIALWIAAALIAFAIIVQIFGAQSPNAAPEDPVKNVETPR